MGQRRRALNRIARLIRLRLLVPLMRSPHPPEYTAWGTAIGLAWAFTPTPGIQMGLVFVTWLIARKLFNFHFSLVLGAAWTWASNVFTGPPVLYISYATGQVMLGRWDNITGYQSFMALWDHAFSTELPLMNQIIMAVKMMIRDWGLAIWLGCIPWCALLGAIGYYWSLRFVRAHRASRARRLARKYEQKHGVMPPA